MVSEMSNRARSEDAVAALLPSGWSCIRQTPSTSADLILFLRAPDGASAELAIDVRTRLQPGSVPMVVARLGRAAPAQPIVVAGWLSPPTRASLTEAGLGYVDLTGNADFRLSRPGLLVRTTGAMKDPDPLPSRLASLRGTGAARAVRAILDFVPPYGVRELARAAR